ncbi:MAG: hypothetical protein IH622_03640 [Ochrobactrum anthropi]|uniref:Uncharacterized protein n=1 Tax=Brucella anthropi TaxID=529 RepID=A0A8I0N3B7_BRUAN|nr:hypothetical protein [Brucella anthropi]MBE0559912.1 hypothetical protein [Brucella anthropi]
MGKKSLTRDQLIAHRDEHLQFIRSSSNSFDQGAVGEAKRIAVSLRVLLHETPQSHSILAQLGERQRDMVDTSDPYDPKNLLVHHGLVAVRAGTSAGFFAPLDALASLSRQRKFQDWWEKDIVLKNKDGKTYTRKQLVLFAANKDGGAHVDPNLDDEYSALLDGTAMGWRTGDGSPLADVMAHSIRQMAFELVETLDKHPKSKP